MSDLNLPDQITADELLQAGLSRAEIEAIRGVVPEADATAAVEAAPEAPARNDDKGAADESAIDVIHDGDAFDQPEGGEEDAIIVDESEEALREYDPAKDDAPAPEAEAEPETGPAADLADLLDLKRPEIPAPTRDFAAEEAAQRDRIADLQARYDDGDLTQDDFNAQREAVLDEIVEIRATAKLEAPDATQAFNDFRDGWFRLVDAHVAANPILDSNSEAFDPAAFDAFDKVLHGVSADPVLSRLPAIRQMEIAHQRVAEFYEAARGEPMPAMVSVRTSGAAKAADAAPAAPASEPKPAPKAQGPRTDPRPEPPTTLAGVAGAQPARISEDPAVANVLALMNSGRATDAEAAMARLTPAQQRQIG